MRWLEAPGISWQKEGTVLLFLGGKLDLWVASCLQLLCLKG